MESASTMLNPIHALRRFLDHRGACYVFALVLLLVVTFVPADAQTAVILAPLPQLQFFDQTGTPLAFGCVFTYQVNSTSPLQTYTDYTGETQNQNPVILTAGGSANIWLLAGQAYTFRVKSAGGTNCSAGSTLYTVNGIGGGASTLTTIVPYSPTPAFQDAAQNQLFEITLTGNASAQPLTFVGVTPPGFITFQITQDGSGFHTFSWPANSVGGCVIGAAADLVTTQQFVYNGTNATAIAPCVTGTGPTIVAGSIYDTGLTASSTVCTSASNLLISGCGSVLNITINGQTCAPGGSCNVNVGAAAHSIALNQGNGNAITGLLLANNQIPVGQTSTNPTGSTIPTCGAGTHLFFSGTLPLTCTVDLAIQAFNETLLGSPVSVSANTATTYLSHQITMPSSGCPCRVQASYGAYFTTGNTGIIVAWISDATDTFSTAQLDGDSSLSNGGINGSGFSPTYANSAVVTFSAQIETSASGGLTVNVSNNSGFPAAQSTWMDLAVFTSN
jgi:hypothetical protein